MNTPADSASTTGEATGAALDAADSTPTQPVDGQEQGSQSNSDESKRVNDLMSLANRRLAERDAALAEIEELRAMLDEASASMYQPQSEQPSQRDLMYPQPEPEPEQSVPEGEPRVVIEANMAPRHPRTPVSTGNSSNPSARYLQDQNDMSALRRELNRQGLAWAHERGLTLD